jgi:hypothetical protein
MSPTRDERAANLEPCVRSPMWNISGSPSAGPRRTGSSELKHSLRISEVARYPSGLTPNHLDSHLRWRLFRTKHLADGPD